MAMHLDVDTKLYDGLAQFATAICGRWPIGRASATAGYGPRHEGRACGRAISLEGRLCHPRDITTAPPRQNRGAQWSPGECLVLASLSCCLLPFSSISPH